MEIILCEHEYWKVDDEVQMIHNKEKGIIEGVERHGELLVLCINFFHEKRKVAGYLVEKVEKIILE